MLQTEQLLQGRYQLREKLGQNAGRQTWLAEDLEAQPRQLVIVKLLAFNPQMHWDELKLFEREGQVLKHLNYPRITKYRDYFSVDKETGYGLPWFGLVQEYIPGESLQQLLDKGKHFSEKQAKEIAENVLEILIYLHELSPPVLHRDIKPSNLILGKNEQIYLVDFGAVQDKATAEGVTFTVVGTSGYAPPEQLWGRAVAASDLYALGATLIHLLTGTAPSDLPQQQMRLQFADKVSLNSNFAQWLERLIDPAPERRFSTARQALLALQTPNTNSENSGEPNSNPVRYGRLLGLASLQLVVIGIAAAIALPSLLNMSSRGCGGRQAEGKTYVGSMNRAQQAYYLENDKFGDSISKLELGIKTQTENYNYSVRLTPNAAFNYAQSRKSDAKSYVGAVTVKIDKATGEKLTEAILCEANSPGLIIPGEPKVVNGKLICASNTKQLGR